jgi:hypothetical protein
LETHDINPFEQIQKFFKDFKGDINIIDEKIDVLLQMEYFEMSKQFRNEPLLSNWEEESEKLYNISLDILLKKKILSQIAAIDDVKAYRAIEKYVKNDDPELRHWALLALQESRMLLQSKLLEQSQVLVSTGLGGKDGKLRYFFVLFNKNNETYTESQQKIIRNEFDYIFKKNNAEIEEITFYENISTILGLVPLNIPIQDIFVKALAEINQFGNFVRENCIITNVRIMTIEEIRAFIDNNNAPTIKI